MSTTKNRSLVFIITVLLITNIAVLSYFLWFKKKDDIRPPRQQSNGIETPLQKEVGFSEEQLNQYRQMRDEQKKAIKPMFEDMRKMKDSLFRMIGNQNANDSVISGITDAIAQKQKELDTRMFNHFKRIRGLCTPEQLAMYDSVVQRMMRKMNGGGKPRKEQDKKEEK